MKIKIHHFFDMIRDFGSNKIIVPHPHLHSYHTVSEIIRKDANVELELVVKPDDVCITCTHLINLKCDDIITHRSDFAGKEDFNFFLDERIMKACSLQISEKYSPKLLSGIAHKYIENIEFIYQGNDKEHTQLRKENVILGLKYYAKKHGFNIKGLTRNNLPFYACSFAF